MSRRRFLARSLGAAAASALWTPRRSAPAFLTRDEARPRVPYGTAAGDVFADRAIVWSRTDRPARMVVEWATSESFAHARRVVGPAALPESDFTARVDLAGLPPGQRIAYRVLFQDLSDLRTWSLPSAGSFVSAPDSRRDVSFAFSGDTAGQGWGIDAARGGMRTYETMRRLRPDFFVHLGDTVYADQPILPEVTLGDGSVWRNLTTAAKAKVAETLDEFRGNHLYNLHDENVRRFNSEVSQLVLWDDHEVRNNWYPTQRLDADPRYLVKSAALLAARAKRAFLEYTPIRAAGDDLERIFRSYAYGPGLEVFALDMRSYRGANSPNRQPTTGEQTDLLGPAQLAWIKQRLQASRATWKVVASDMPLGLIVPDGPSDFEAVANGSGPPLGRELEIAELLRFVREQAIRNVVWITADVHYCAAHHYDPVRARFRDFLPFWEFVAGPLHAGTFGPAALDDTFGPEVRFLGIPKGMQPNRPPSEGRQFFGTFSIDGRSEAATVRLHNLAGETIFEVELAPERSR